MLHRQLGLSDDEFEKIKEILEREPNELELAMFSVMWSEHCSYKSSRTHLKRLPTEAPWVLVGPGENAGVIDAGHGVAIALRIESHNHPSAVEPYQGAATGVGGILRDIFTMGARPIALMDPLRFGPQDDPTSRWHFEGVVAGISGYGNAVGVPTVGGETVFDECYAENPLVNVACIGLLPTERLVLGQATGEGNLAVLLGSRTGRDGIGGVSILASAGFDEGQESKRPSVQVGDPYEEKRLIEACLSLLDERLVVGIQDLGGAGLTCATSETASRGHMGMDVDVSAVPLRESGMTPVETMTSESQERMLAIVEPSGLERVLELCAKWEVRATVIGRVTSGGALRILDGFDGPVLAEVPASALHDDAPVYCRPMSPIATSDFAGPSDQELGDRDATADLLALMGGYSWVWQQYDHQLFLNTVVGPGPGATVLSMNAPGVPPHPGAMVLSTDGSGRWCRVDPRLGTLNSVVESALNVACMGAVPKAVVNCLNFGNPEHPEVMWQLSESIDGMSEACKSLELPVVGGNVSLYNESRGKNIDPTPVVCVVGLIDRLESRPNGPIFKPNRDLYLLGASSLPSEIAGSKWAQMLGATGGRLEHPDLEKVKNLLGFLSTSVKSGLVESASDVSEGGLALCLAEMCVHSQTGATIDHTLSNQELFSESPGRVVVAVDSIRADELEVASSRDGVDFLKLGSTGGASLTVGGVVVSLDKLVQAHARGDANLDAAAVS